MFPDKYLQNKLYLFDYGTSEYNKVISDLPDGFTMKRLGFDSLSAVENLQRKVVDGMENKNLFYPLSREELIESMQLDYISGIFSPEGRLAAFSVIVSNRDGERSLASDVHLNPSEVFTFDAVAVDNEYRGRGFQRTFIGWSIELAKSSSVKYIVATVDPQNTPSERNFLAQGFHIAETKTKYIGLTRDILRLDV